MAVVTRDALAIKAAQGVRLGRPATLDPCISVRIVNEHAAGAWLVGYRSLP